MSIDIQELLAKVPTGLLIGGKWQEASSGETFDVENPATGEKLATLSSANSDDAVAALDAACAVQADWAKTSPRERSNILRRAFELVTERKDEFAALMTLEMGKPLAEAYGEVTYGAEYLRWFSEEAVRDYGRSLPAPEGTLRMVTRRKPVGPCLLITPWNFPLAMATRKVAPAVAAGCVMVLKPAKLTPLTSQYFAQTMIEAGLPAGVLNVVSGQSASAISEPLLADSRLRKVSFTGSTAVGKTLLKAAAENVLRTSMELGGNAPFIVFEDADIDQAVAGAMGAKMRNIGEACTAANRFII
ncbi:MAG: aldehyde dehydrogenase family protein, partial [Corynebacterium flavescens]|nr:aldehyde dehydrogenase family protein [Corynebacterium flavescens]